jgi:hypothetical protein
MKLDEYELLMLIIEAKIKANKSTLFSEKHYNIAQDLEKEFKDNYVEKRNENEVK